MPIMSNILFLCTCKIVLWITSSKNATFLEIKANISFVACDTFFSGIDWVIIIYIYIYY
jgi:hypothetical protein